MWRKIKIHGDNRMKGRIVLVGIISFLFLSLGIYLQQNSPSKENYKEKTENASIAVDILESIIYHSPKIRSIVGNKTYIRGKGILHWENGTYTKATVIIWVGGHYITKKKSQTEVEVEYVDGEPYIVEINLINKTVISIKKADRQIMEEFLKQFYEQNKNRLNES